MDERENSRLLIDKIAIRYERWSDRYWWLFIVFMVLIMIAVVFG